MASALSSIGATGAGMRGHPPIPWLSEVFQRNPQLSAPHADN
ncbi:hypothetical protein [Pandoraea sp. NPDC087047]